MTVAVFPLIRAEGAELPSPKWKDEEESLSTILPSGIRPLGVCLGADSLGEFGSCVRRNTYSASLALRRGEKVSVGAEAGAPRQQPDCCSQFQRRSVVLHQCESGRRTALGADAATRAASVQPSLQTNGTRGLLHASIDGQDANAVFRVY